MESMRCSLTEKMARRVMGRKSREKAQWYTWDRCIKGYDKIYSELMKR
jgi:glycosyltransferase involved in cell wall biosynthesis